jgi:peptidoglycan hydrolase-like protein with peptidoglycan-binding domain
MRYSLLATAAALAFAAPALAQTNPPPSLDQQLQMPVAPPGLGERITSGVETTEHLFPAEPSIPVSPGQLDAAQIRQLQQALSAQGYPVRRVDGVWGPETAGALQSFQQRQNPTAAPGQLDSQTLAQLGVIATPTLGLRRGPAAVGAAGIGTAGAVPRRGAPGAPVPGSGLQSTRFAPETGLGSRAGFGSDLGASRSAFGGATNPPSTPGLDAPGNNGMHPESSFSIPDATRPAGARFGR